MNNLNEEMTDAERVSVGHDENMPDLLREVFSELEASNEELRVTEEELLAQNEILADTSLALEKERRLYRDLFHTAPDPYLLTDLNGLVQEANFAACSLLGVGPSSLAKKPLAVYVAPDSRRTFRTKLLGQTKVCEQGIYLQSKRGELLYATLRVAPVPDAEGKPVGLRWVVRGATPDPKAELEQYRRLITDVRDFAIFIIDEDHRITSWNKGAELIFGYTPDEVIGCSADLIFTPEDLAADAAEQERERARATGYAEDERWHVRKDGSRLWASGVLTAFSDKACGPLWYAKIVRDLTDRRLQEQRDHEVATQLQAAVQPDVPLTVPGLAVRSFYRPAYKDISVGGDFFDVFSLGDGRSVLVVGDVSGKGLEAAAQVAMIRTMIRYALYDFSLYKGRTLAAAITTLNSMLAGHKMLEGFVTLFVSVFDVHTRTLTYVNCGQEPAMVRHAMTKQVTLLSSTGPLLGLFKDSEFSESEMTLSTMDALVIFTDGLTDIGPTRTEMLEADGVATLLRGSIAKLNKASTPLVAEAVMARLIRAVNAQAPEHIPDDICILVAVAE